MKSSLESLLMNLFSDYLDYIHGNNIDVPDEIDKEISVKIDELHDLFQKIER